MVELVNTYQKRLKLVVPSQTDYLAIVRRFVAEVAHLAGFSEDAINSIELAVDEACANVIEHAYEHDSKKEIDVHVEYDDRKFIISVIDTGKGFNPKDFKTADVGERLGAFKRGGLGIHLMKQLMDEVEYAVVPADKNQVRLTKYLPTRKRPRKKR
jgi:serine/threonine-protein kinase RsbW